MKQEFLLKNGEIDMNNTQAIKILAEEKSWESDDRKIDAFILGIEALKSVAEMKGRIELADSMLNETIKCQRNKMEIANKDENDIEYLKAYDIKSLCEQIKDILDGNFDISE